MKTEDLIRHDLIQQLYFETWPKFAAAFNAYKSEGSKVVILNFAAMLGIEIFQDELPNNVAGRITTEKFVMRFIDSDIFNYFIFFHEYTHYKLHKDQLLNPKVKLLIEQMELEADAFALLIMRFLAPEHYDLCLQFAKDNPKLTKS